MAADISNDTGQERELLLRSKLGIPADAERVIVFAESSHWDPNWVFTSEQYFRRFVGGNLDRALYELSREPRRIYSVECAFFLRMYWDRRPDRRQTIRDLVNDGRLRLTSSGVTTSDTVLPRTEAILRDLLLGQEWLRTNGMTQEPRLAYFPDSFGHSPALPSILRAAGFDKTAITRIDGMFFAGADYELPSRFPRRGSSAERLLEQEKSLDFVWRGPDGAEVLCHWNAYTYGQGDLLAHRGIVRIYNLPLAVAARSDRHVARRIGQFASQLAPVSRTPYLFCPIGFDFVRPIPGLVGLLDRYNRNHYPAGGVWAVNAGLDDYLELVDCQRGALPVLELDPNPYWTGFYSSRPSLKKRCHELLDDLLLAERLAVLAGSEKERQAAASELRDAWWDAAVSNHHDFITGTSPDRVVTGEQLPWLARAAAKAKAVATGMAVHMKEEPRRAPVEEPPEWWCAADKITVETPYYRVEFAEAAGGAITRAWHRSREEPVLSGISNDLVSYRDSGGLWRMGQEFVGGRLRELSRASATYCEMAVEEGDGWLDVSCSVELDGEPIRRSVRLSRDSPLIRFHVEGRAAKRRTVTVRFDAEVAGANLTMDAPGGLIARPPRRFYEPTFWPAQSFVHLRDEAGGHGLALCTRFPGAVSYGRDGGLELVALRNATHERAFGFLPIPGMPMSGHEHEVYAFDYALLLTSAGDWRENQIPTAANTHRPTASPVTCDSADVYVAAVKPASRGEGVIVRLLTFGPFGQTVSLDASALGVRAASLCDARERDLEPVEVQGGKVRLQLAGAISTLRLLTDA